eukprot:CAMPEP_0196731166 /NCGR_PEP_ID=MMETSP1091-20130531/11007_1 /TAXON_ID=302021 /ORGANISM="Rhodomonas sp., Strain CCMP768" /LENGTH=38 /DNA_ID= /DNA_START= /DNA_END= /DNA_ORIENTATION=
MLSGPIGAGAASESISEVSQGAEELTTGETAGAVLPSG